MESEPVHEVPCKESVTDNDGMSQVVSLPPQESQDLPEEGPREGEAKDTQEPECNKYGPRELGLLPQIGDGDEDEGGKG